MGSEMCIRDSICLVRPRPTEVKCEKSRRRTNVPKAGYCEIWFSALEKMMECGKVMFLYKTPKVAACNVWDVSRHETKSTLRGA